MGLLDKDTFVCIDCETTGLDVDQDRIIEVAVVKFKMDKTLEEFESLVDPERDIPQTSIDIHHITPEMVKGKPKIADLLPQVIKIIGRDPIVGHGVLFDVELIVKAAERVGMPCLLRNNPMLDTLRLARLYGESPENSLDTLRKHFNIEAEGAHRAMGDVIINIAVFKHLVHRFKTTEEVIKRLERPIELKKMPLGKHKGRPFKEVPLQYLQWAANKQFDQDLLFSIRSELKRRKQGSSFSQSVNPFQQL